MKLTSTLALLTGALLISVANPGCDTPDEIRVSSGTYESGSLRLALETGGVNIDTVTAVISGDDGFVTQTHEIDVRGDQGAISIFFGELPEGDYEILLAAADCGGSAEFTISAGEVAFVNVVMSCGGTAATTGSVQITGTIVSGSLRDCDHVLKIVAAPSIQKGDGPNSAIELFLKPGVTPTDIEWSITSSNGGTGGLFGVDDDVDTDVSFDCSTNGTVSVVATVVAPCDEEISCRQQARAQVECINQSGQPPTTEPPRCGDGVVNAPGEQCDGSAPLPAGTPAGSTCSTACTIVPPPTTPPVTPPTTPPVTPPTTPPVTPPTTPPTTPGACFACAQASCPAQYAAAVAATDAATLADVAQLFACVIGPSWQAGGAIPVTSCFFSDPVQPLGSLVPCYCGSTPQATCLATGPINNQEACGLEVEVASRCNPVSASCVTSSGSNAAVPLGAALQLFNCERAACPDACGFPPPVEE